MTDHPEFGAAHASAAQLQAQARAQWAAQHHAASPQFQQAPVAQPQQLQQVAAPQQGQPHQHGQPNQHGQPPQQQYQWNGQNWVPAAPTGQAPFQVGQPPAGAVDAETADPNETHVTLHPPGKPKHWLFAGAGALALLALVAMFALRGGGDGEVETVGEDPTETDATTEADTPEQLAFEDLEDRLDNLEDDEDIIIIDDNNGGYGGYGGGGYGGYGGYGTRNDGIVIGGDGDGIVIGDDLVDDAAEPLVSDDELGDGGNLVLDEAPSTEAPIVFPSCDIDDDHENGSTGDGDADNENGSTGDGDAAPENGPDLDSSGEAPPTSVEFPYTDDFSLGAPVAWTPLNGTWGLTGENYQQTDPDSFGNITELQLEPPAEYAATVSLSPLGTTIGGGMLVGQPTPGSRNGATVIDLTNDGTFLRWGGYDAESGDYLYEGGVAVPEGFDPTAAHTMEVRVEANKTSVSLDDEVVAEFGPVGAGRMGLFTSQSAVAFDDLTISDLSVNSEGN